MLFSKSNGLSFGEGWVRPNKESLPKQHCS
jgi:hypothetical protein